MATYKELVAALRDVCARHGEPYPFRYRRDRQPIPPDRAKRIADIVAMATDGNHSMSEVSERFGLSRERVRQIILRETGKTGRELRGRKIASQKRRNGAPTLEERRVAKVRARRDRQAAYDAEIVALRKSGMSIKEIAHKVGRNEGGVSTRLIFLGHRTNVKKQRRDPDRDKRVVELSRSGLCNAEIGRIVGLRWMAVKAALVRAGLAP